MNISTDKDLWVSWREYHEKILGLARVVHDSGWKFDRKRSFIHALLSRASMGEDGVHLNRRWTPWQKMLAAAA